MNPANLKWTCGFGLAIGLAVPLVSAQNLLTNNASFEANAAYYTPAWGFPEGSPNVLPGWLITLDANGDGYAGAANNQSPENLEGSNFGYIYSGTGSAGTLETAPESRAAVSAGDTYTLWFLARGDATWGDASASVSLVWHPNQNNGATVGQPTNLDLTLPARIATVDPMQPFHLTATAPSGAHYASVRVTRPPYDYVPMIVDDFVIMAEPTQVVLAVNKHSSNVVLSWPRSLKYKLEENHNPTISNGWSKANRPVKGKKDKNFVEYPLDEAAQFFRLKAED